MNKINVAALQLVSLSYDAGKIDYYMTIAKREDVKVLVLGEYVLNLFFKDLETTPINFIKEQSKRHIEDLKKLSRVYNVHIVAPIVTFEKNEPIKTLVVFTPKGMKKYHQQILMPYKHWNEEKYFKNPQDEIKLPLTFNLEGVKFGVVFGYELHFDKLWEEFKKAKVDCVLMPTVSAFNSNMRWRELVKTRAFLNQYYILRANRIGHYESNEGDWKFYGDSFISNPYGEIEEFLGSKEEILITTIDKQVVKDARADWKFQRIGTKRGL